MLVRVAGRIARRIAGAVFVAALMAFSASAQEGRPLRGVALVIGQSAYEHIPPLANPANDARDVEAVLDALGFDTTLVSDRDARRLSRDLERFLEDADDADVATIYYAGHGIEAGGENFLVPVDADLSALEAAGTRLVPVSGFIARLQEVVPVVIVMLDACRDNPFPAGAPVRLDAGSDAVPMGDGGLGETRGATRLGAPATPQADENVGTVVAFAAEPGRVALDGAPGQNSPYAAAVLRHLETMAGEEFGLVMRMVAEEVYLKTGGRQRPWVNESMRRLLYFGSTPDPLAGEEGEIVSERRQLLVTIAALPDHSRRQIERVAAEGGVPMDALYAMLRTLGADVPEDPLELEQMLRAQTQRIAELLAERDALVSGDAEVERLSHLAGEAVAEGAFDTALRLHDRAKARVAELSSMLDDTEAALMERRREFALVYARSGDSRWLAFDHLQAADDYASAFAQVSRWDDELAWRYKRAEAVALFAYGRAQGDKNTLERALAAGREAVAIADRLDGRLVWASTRSDVGSIHMALSLHDNAVAHLAQAVTSFLSAVQEYPGGSPEWAWAQNLLGDAFLALAYAERDTSSIDLAISTYRLAADAFGRENAPERWADTGQRLAHALVQLARRKGGPEHVAEAVSLLEDALRVVTRERYPLDWAGFQAQFGDTLTFRAYFDGRDATLREAIAAAGAALEEFPRESYPLQWAQMMQSLSLSKAALGRQTGDEALIREALGGMDAALEVRTRERGALARAAMIGNRAIVLRILGEMGNDEALLAEAIAGFEESLLTVTREATPTDWARVQTNLGRARAKLSALRGVREPDATAIGELIAAAEEHDRELSPIDSALDYHNLGIAMLDLAEYDTDERWLRYAINGFGSSLSVLTREAMPAGWAESTRLLGWAKVLHGERSGDSGEIEEGLALLREADAFFLERSPRMHRAFFAEKLAYAGNLLKRD